MAFQFQVLYDQALAVVDALVEVLFLTMIPELVEVQHIQARLGGAVDFYGAGAGRGDD